MKLIWFNGLPEIYAQLEEVVGSICTGVVVFHRSIVNWRRECERSFVNLRRGGVNLPWVYVHSAIYVTYLV